MNAKEEIKRHRLPCGPMAVSIESVCRRRLRDSMDALLDKLTRETHPEGVDRDILEMEEQVDIPEDGEQEETEEQKKERMLREGKMKIDVKRELAKYEADTPEDPEVGGEKKETDDEAKKRMIKEGKMRADVKKVVQKYEEKIMPKPKETPKTKPKAKTSDHAESEDNESQEKRLQGNSKLLQDITGKIPKK